MTYAKLLNHADQSLRASTLAIVLFLHVMDIFLQSSTLIIASRV